MNEEIARLERLAEKAEDHGRYHVARAYRVLITRLCTLDRAA